MSRRAGRKASSAADPKITMPSSSPRVTTVLDQPARVVCPTGLVGTGPDAAPAVPWAGPASGKPETGPSRAGAAFLPLPARVPEPESVPDPPPERVSEPPPAGREAAALGDGVGPLVPVPAVGSAPAVVRAVSGKSRHPRAPQHFSPRFFQWRWVASGWRGSAGCS
jgi:hypothetical protein